MEKYECKKIKSSHKYNKEKENTVTKSIAVKKYTCLNVLLRIIIYKTKNELE